jgi:hypothetical protein
MVIFRSKKGSAVKNVWETVFYGDCMPSETMKHTWAWMESARLFSGFSRHGLIEVCSIQFQEHSSRGSPIVVCRQKKRPVTTKLVGAFCTYTKALKWRGSRHFNKITRQHSRPQFYLPPLGSLTSWQTWRHLLAKVGTSKERGKVMATYP